MVPLSQELLKLWINLTKFYNPDDYIDFWNGMGEVEGIDYLLYNEITRLTENELKEVRNNMAKFYNFIRSFEK